MIAFQGTKNWCKVGLWSRKTVHSDTQLGIILMRMEIGERYNEEITCIHKQATKGLT
jgi:hypothetical protein